MSDMNLLLFGVVVFGLMLIGVLFTVVEFRHLSNEDTSGSDTQPGSHGSSRRRCCYHTDTDVSRAWELQLQDL